MCFALRLDGGGVEGGRLPPGDVRLGVALPPSYPHGGGAPRLQLLHGMQISELPREGAEAVQTSAGLLRASWLP